MRVEQNVLADDMATLSYYASKIDVMGNGDAVNQAQLKENFASCGNDVHLYKSLIYPEALRARWNAVNISL